MKAFRLLCSSNIAFEVLGPVLLKMVKANPGLIHIFSKVFWCKNMELELTKFC